MGVFTLSRVVCIVARPTFIILLRGTGLKVIPLWSSLTWRSIAVLSIVPFLWNMASSKQPSAATIAALDPGVTAGVGAPLEFVEYEAENAATNGRIVGPDRTFTTLASEASGRRAVLLENPGDYVEFTLSAPANALTVRYAVPDGPEGKPVDARLGVYAQGHRIADLGSMDAPIKAQIDLETTTLLDSSREAVLLLGNRIDGLVVNGLRVDRAGGSPIELRAEGSATLSGVGAAGVLDPAVRTCGAFQLDWRGSTNSGSNSSSTRGC
jgi:hypothetical protein